MECGVCKHKDCQASDIVGAGTCNSSRFLSLHKSFKSFFNILICICSMKNPKETSSAWVAWKAVQYLAIENNWKTSSKQHESNTAYREPC